MRHHLVVVLVRYLEGVGRVQEWTKSDATWKVLAIRVETKELDSPKVSVQNLRRGRTGN